MEGHKEVHASRCAFSGPVCSYRARSWCDRWLSCSSDQRVFFGTVAEASDFFLLPQGDGRYKLQFSSSWFLCCRDSAVGCARRDPECCSEDVLFALEMDESGRASFRGGSQAGYLTSDWHGRLYGGTAKARKWEMFMLVERSMEDVPKIAPWIVRAPVRVTLQASTKKYLCAARHVVSARAEAPCCCEEFLIDLIFSSFPAAKSETAKPSQKSRGLWQALLGRGDEEEEAEVVSEPARHCTIRTNDGTCLLSAEPDGNVFTTRLNHAQGRETFSIQLHSDSKISIQQATSESDSQGHLSVEFGQLIYKRVLRRGNDLFNIQLASGSRILLRSVHGGFLSTDTGKCRIISSEKKDFLQGIGAWHLRAHGDSLYTLTALSTVSKRRADVYMFVDASGRVNQSSDPAVHFPCSASLFEIKPVSNATILPGTICRNASIIGFTIRTARKIHGKHRYLSAEPNGVLRAVRLAPSRWELFQLIDVDAAAAAAAPESFSCTPAAVNREPPPTCGPVFSTSASRATKTGFSRIVLRDVSACDAAAMALLDGHAVPKKSAASLQDLCISQVCVHASAEISSEETTPECRSKTYSDEEFTELVSALCSLSRRHDLLPAGIPSDLTDENAFSIPDDLLARIWETCRLRQVPQNSCKWMQSAFLPQTQAQGPRARNRAVSRSSSTEAGWHCTSCKQSNVLPMDAAVNPAHHKYLEVQSRVYSRAIQSTGILWNIISLAGVSIMSTALFCQLKAAATRRSLSF
ncbi:hypothetical protein SELMODRAFT_440909 [Selaginella moellendorffii]|uniref:Fascin domain-containing protein n=1 Tax=Selaginella moellendorffii TaxID=88036 RepID=D8RFA3_SELML|nr:uncharacterized protein LOC9645925 isoform X1 [Selaginella moellendorffii]EFJ29083.1 hypothetical protein SELMODRAFT_440909 [Selaginella moellendorffii]|eukprot:XP_002969959.1 uncharacterized protein LOC9645925 isoform X1 [Selaginella moellendorffii]